MASARFTLDWQGCDSTHGVAAAAGLDFLAAQEWMLKWPTKSSDAVWAVRPRLRSVSSPASTCPSGFAGRRVAPPAPSKVRFSRRPGLWERLRAQAPRLREFIYDAPMTAPRPLASCVLGIALGVLAACGSPPPLPNPPGRRGGRDIADQRDQAGVRRRHRRRPEGRGQLQPAGSTTLGAGQPGEGIRQQPATPARRFASSSARVRSSRDGITECSA